MDQDTSPRQRQRYIELLRAQDPVQRLHAVTALTRAVRRMAWAGLQERYPHDDEASLKVRLTTQLYGRDVARRLFGNHPALDE